METCQAKFWSDTQNWEEIQQTAPWEHVWDFAKITATYMELC